MITGYLLDIIIIFAAAILIIAIGNRVKIPGIVGFIVTGIVIGPYGLGLIKDVAIVDALADIGIIFLLFTIGMQFSFRTLYDMRKIVVVGGTIQVLGTIAATLAITYFFGVPLNQGIFLGFLICHSSTVITLKIYQDRAEMDSPQARATIGISLYQDIITVPMLIALPLLAGEATDITGSLVSMGVTLVALLVFVFAVSVYLIPRVMTRITGTRNPEIFLLSIILICFVITYITSSIGLSVALGAFLAGITLSESEYFHQAFASILPFKEIFTSFFFISIGMLINLWFIIRDPVLIVALLIGVLVLKAVIAGGATLAIGHSLRTSILAGLALCNIGEFAFVISIPGTSYGLFSQTEEQIFLAVTVITMSLTPIMISAGPKVADFCCNQPSMARLNGVTKSEERERAAAPPVQDHLVIIGYGLNGRNLARAAKAGGIAYRIIDLNPDTVAKERKKGEPIFFGDATSESILSNAEIGKARILVIVINDPPSTRVITQLARQMNPHLYIIVRTRFMTEVKTLEALGANEVIPEEFETSIEIFTRVLKKYLVPRSTIDGFVREVRAGTYQMFRSPPESGVELTDLKVNLPDSDIACLAVFPNSPVAKKSLLCLNMRREYGISVLAIRRNGEIMANPDGDSLLEPGDEVIVIGAPDKIARIVPVFHPYEEPV
ncbi:cation:proton antiporter [Methanoregula sp.]|uniref:cation:proton antiporter domain-containing protein n=1 Tax=Methanoregula sp. TaxID=2052170 RepID=UPI0035685552